MRKLLLLLLLLFTIPVCSASTGVNWLDGYDTFSGVGVDTFGFYNVDLGTDVYGIYEINCTLKNNAGTSKNYVIQTLGGGTQPSASGSVGAGATVNFMLTTTDAFDYANRISIISMENVDYTFDVYYRNNATYTETNDNYTVYINASVTPELNATGYVNCTFSSINFTINGYVGNTIVLLDGANETANATRTGETVSLAITALNNSSHWVNISTVYNKEPTLSAPADDSVHNYSYPPMTHLINLSSEDVCAYTRYKIWQGNVLKYSTLVAGNSTGVYLPSGTYMWSAESYSPELGTYSTYDTRNFTINDLLSHPVNATGVYGVIYEDLAGMDTAVESALVTVYNASWSDELITDEYGYYEFYNLTNGTYYISVSKDRYDAPAVKYITLTTNNMSLMNIYIERNTGDYYARHDVKFTVKSLLGTRYENIEATAYISGSTNIYDVDDTDSSGSVVFPLEEDTEYTITFINATQSISREITLYPVDDEYIIYVLSSTEFDLSDMETDDISTSVTTNEINTTHAYINVTYNDSLGETTALNIYIYQTNLSDPANMTLIDSAVCGGVSNHTESFLISGYSGEAYQINIDATHTTFGDVDKTFAVRFDTSYDFPNGMLYFAVFGLGFLSMMFKKSNVEEGAVVFCAVAWLLGSLNFFGDYWTTAMKGFLALASVAAVAAVMAKGEKES